MKDDLIPIEEETVGRCVICSKRWIRKEADKWVFHISKGVICKHHIGVEDWYNNLLKISNINLTKDEG